MLSYLLHLVQLLNVVYFLVLKRAYSYKTKALIYYYTKHTIRLNYLLVFQAVFQRLFILADIYLAIKGVGLISL
jgi:hypothetical protein